MSVKLYNQSEYGYTLTEPVSETPFTISCWFKLPSIDHNQVVVAIDTPAAAGYQILAAIEASGGSAGDPVKAYNYNGADYGIAETSSGYSADTWMHGCGVFTNATSRAAFIGGGSKGVNTDDVVGIPSELVICRRRRNSPQGILQPNSYVAEIAVWSVALSDANVALLAAGASPLLIDPGNLVAYWPLLNDALDDVGSNDLTIVDLQFDADHPSGTPPFITDQSSDSSVLLGQLLTLSVTAYANPSPTYQWYKNGVLLVGETSSILSLYSTVDTPATYMCRVTNVEGSVDSTGIVVTVVANPYSYYLLNSKLDKSWELS